MPVYYGVEMAVEAKYHITKMLQNTGKRAIAYGDGMHDYFMLKKANQRYLIKRLDGFISSSLKGKDIEGLILV